MSYNLCTLKKHQPKKCHLHIRLSAEELGELRLIANRNRISMTEVVLMRLRNVPVPDYAFRQELYTLLQAATLEINHIGNNINQVTVNLHILRKRQQSPIVELDHFNRLFESYLQLLEQLSIRLDKMARL